MYLGSEIVDQIWPENGMRGYLKAIDPMTEGVNLIWTVISKINSFSRSQRLIMLES